MRWAGILVLSVTGCASLRMARAPVGYVRTLSPDACAKLSTKVQALHIASIILGGGGTAAAGIAPALTDTLSRDLVLGAGGLCSLAGAVVSYVGGTSAATYAKECP